LRLEHAAQLKSESTDRSQQSALAIIYRRAIGPHPPNARGNFFVETGESLRKLLI
jgi:hypothetical protein